jgi:carbonic anhydrase
MTISSPDPDYAKIQANININIGNNLQKLIEGNKRYTAGRPVYPNQSAERRIEVAQTPRPFAVILSCSDSRVPPEIIFDQGIGDLFVIRVAGNLLNKEITGSIEYAVEYFGTRLIVVMGHTKCGAVTAAIQNGDFPGQINSLVDAIRPAVEKAKSIPGDLLNNTVNENINMVVGKLKSIAPVLNTLYGKGELEIIGACYDVEDGKVVFYK